MNEKTFLSGRLEKAFFYLGPLPADSSRRRFVKAPFDLYHLNGEMYLMPVGCYACGRAEDIKGVLGFDEGDEFDLAQQFAFDSLENIVLERHEMGDFKGSKNNWLQVHLFGPV